MLVSFWTKNYRNIKMDKPIIWERGINFVYGVCGSGKTNLCMAMMDIIRHNFEYKENCNAQFSYSFLIDEKEIQYEYKRAEDGNIVYAKLEIPQYHFVFYLTKKVGYPLGIFNEVLEGDSNERVKEICKKSKEIIEVEIVGKRIKYMEDIFDLNKNTNKICGFTDSEKKGIIFDDADSYGTQSIKEALDDAIEKHSQLILICRRSEWISEIYGNKFNYYYIHQGEIKKVVDWITKDITNVKQIKAYCI